MKNFLGLLLLLIIVFFYTRPYFRTGFFPTHDGEWAVIRLAEMKREIKDLQIPPRWSDYLNHGYGYPLFNFTYPLPYYLGVAIHSVGFGLTDTIKILFVGSVVISTIFMYLLGKELVSKLAGVIAANFYIVAPYRLVDLYVRGSIGESLAFALFPILMLAGVKYILKPSTMRMCICSAALASLILTHNVMAIIFIPFWIVFLYIIVLSYYEDIWKYSWRYFTPMLILGLGIAAFFFIPALLEKKYIILSSLKLADVTEHFIPTAEFISSTWSYGLKPSFQLGYFQIAATGLTLLTFLLTNPLQKKKYARIYFYLLFSILILIFLTNGSSLFAWNFPPLSWIDFPWRLMGILIFFLALSTIILSINKASSIVAIILVSGAIIVNLHSAVPSEYIDKPDSYYETNDATTTSLDELMPIWVGSKPANRYTNKVEAEFGNATFEDVKYNSKSITFATVSNDPSDIRVNTIYYPGWEFTVDKTKVDLNYSNSGGLMTFTVPDGKHVIEGKFVSTPIRRLSEIISTLCLGIIIAIISIYFLSSLKRPNNEK